MAVPDGVRGVDHKTRRLVSEADDTLGLPGAQGGSYHRWLGDQIPPFTLLLAVDDATGAVVNALFCEQEDSRGYFRLMQGLIRRRGVPVALCTYRQPVLKHKLDRQPTQFARTMDELGVQMIFALSLRAKGRVERAAGTFQDRLITELRLAGATTEEEARAVLQQPMPRFNRRFRIPAQCPDPAFQPLPPGLRLGQILCFKHKRRVVRDNTVKFQRHIRQLLPGGQRHSYAGATMLVLQSLDGRLSLQHEGRIIAAQTAPASPGSLPNGIRPSPSDAIPYVEPEDGAKPPERPPNPLALVAAENGLGSVADDEDVISIRETASPNRPSFLQQARWDAMQRAKLQGLSIRRMARELGLHRDTLRKYIDTESPPTRRSPTTSLTPTFDPIA